MEYKLKTKNPDYYKNYYLKHKTKIDEYNKKRYYEKIKNNNLSKQLLKKKQKKEVKVNYGKFIIHFE
tara:strand:- start:441 stop:641 length:201 start_codon:yes stop_codon:yes gene_type:complete